MPMDSKDKNIGKNKQFISSIEFAFTGIKTVFKEERNMRKHVGLESNGMALAAVSRFLGLDRGDHQYSL